MTSIRRRLTQRLLLGWGMILVAGGAVAYTIARAALTRQFDDALYARALALTSAIEQEEGRITVDLNDPVMRDFGNTNRMAFFQVWHADGTEIARSQSLGAAALPSGAGSVQRPEYSNMKFADGTAVRAIGFKFEPANSDEASEGNARSDAIVVVALNRRDLDSALSMLALVLGGSGLLVLAVTAASVPWFLRRELSPLDRLSDQAQRITVASLNERFPKDEFPAELVPISDRLNDLLQRLQVSFERERQFSDELAHEFRTPIAELRSLAELALKWPEARDAETDSHVLAIALQMEGMIERLLTIARSDRPGQQIELQQIRLAEMISTICDPLRTRAAARQLSLETNVPTAAEISSDPVLLRCILTNLLDNAVEYADPAGQVRIEAELQDGHFALRVTNRAKQLDPDDVSRLFERFWRKDAARSGNNHAGLGLSLARALAVRLGYDLNAALNGHSLLTMTLSGPAYLQAPGHGDRNDLANKPKHQIP